MERPKLIYFDGQGRAEVSRWIFLLAGVEYEDVRIQYSDWSTLKSSKFFRIPNFAIELYMSSLSEAIIITQSFIFFAAFRFGKLPVLEYDGKTIAQSRAIARFLGRKYGLAGKTEIEDAEADMIVDYIAETNDGKCWLVIRQFFLGYCP